MITALHSFVRRRSNATLAIVTLATLGNAFACPTLSTAQTEIDPWSQLRALKDGLTGEVVSADFVQTFLPSGFSSGDEEAGVLSISIPDCLRWDYHQPYSKTYLVCGQEAYTWNEGESQGRRFLLESDSEPGLDFLRLQIEKLESRYSVESEAIGETQLEIVFTPVDPGHSLVSARIVLDMESHRLSRLTYEDLEGNQTPLRGLTVSADFGPSPVRSAHGCRVAGPVTSGNSLSGCETAPGFRIMAGPPGLTPMTICPPAPTDTPSSAE